MDKSDLVKKIRNTSFNINKRNSGPDRYSGNTAFLDQIHELIAEGHHEEVLSLISDLREKRPDVVKRYIALLQAESVSLIATKQIERALSSLEKARCQLKLSLNDNNTNEAAVRKNLSSIDVNVSTCHILNRDYEFAAQHALRAREWDNRWHGPHVNIFTSYSRAGDEEKLRSAIKYMLHHWPEWNSDKSFASHLNGTGDLIPDTDLAGIHNMLAEHDHDFQSGKTIL